MKRIAVAGAGFSGAVIARELAQAGYEIHVFDSRNHIAGNCYSARDLSTNVMVHVYGPHIFHTSNEIVWDYIRQFDEFMPFTNRVKAITNNKVYSLPINLQTINSFFNKTLSPNEAELFISSLADKTIANPVSFEDQALKFVGRDLYQAFFKEYTKKQWGLDPSQLPSSILKRLPLRFDYNDNYYASRFQGMPKHGYTHIIEKILDHQNISVKLSTKFTRELKSDFDHVFYSGPIDSWFNHSEGRLAYRTLDFKAEIHDGDYQGNAVINYCDSSKPWTRISEHKHFSPWEVHSKTIIHKEYSRNCGVDDTPYYPVRLVDDKVLLERYVQMANMEERVTFVGRLGTYRYLDMHITIEEALKTASIFKEMSASRLPMTAFSIDPLS